MLEKILIRIFIIIIMLSVFTSRNNPTSSYANISNQVPNIEELKDSLRYSEIKLAPYEKRIGEVSFSSPVFEKQLNLIN